MISSDYTGFITHFTMLIAIIVMMFITSPIMAILYILIVPVIIILVKHLTNESQEGFERQKTMISDLNTQMNDIISSHKSIKVDDLEKRMMDDFRDSNRRFTDAYFTSHSRSGMIKPVIGTMVNVGYLIVVIAGAILLVKDLISVGMFLTFMIYVRIVTGPIMTTSNIYNGMRDRMLSLNRVMEILNAPIEEHDGNERIDIKGRVEFKDVTFHYRDGPDVLHSVSFTIEPGRMTALVGATASGKTTISNILMGFYQPSSGTIEIDGVNRNDIDQDILHRSMASVLQDPWMFDGTLRENIIYNRPWISEEEMLKVSRFVGLDDFVLRLPMGYDTPVNEEILKLPLAQRRMLAMARALIGDPKIIVLDESVAGIDPISGQTIIEGLKKFSKDRTVILITHNQAVIDQADDVIHILDGRIVD